MRSASSLLPLAVLLCAAGTACAPAQSHNPHTAADERIGVLQCDQYLDKMSACIRQAPAARRDALTAQARETFATWKQAAANPQHRDTLPQACTVSLELAREELAPLGCTL
jgi:hypothetical protein